MFGSSFGVNVSLLNENSHQCLPCPSGYYRNDSGSQGCSPCPPLSVSTSPLASSSCRTIIGAYVSFLTNNISNGGSAILKLCPVGTFGINKTFLIMNTKAEVNNSGTSSNMNQTNIPCLPCPYGQSTMFPGATSEQDCMCDIGFQRNASSISGACSSCPADSVKLNIGFNSCVIGKQVNWLPLSLNNSLFVQLPLKEQMFLRELSQSRISSSLLFSQSPVDIFFTNVTTPVDGRGPCPPGWQAWSRKNVCIPCDLGTFKSSDGNGTCSLCPKFTSSRFAGGTSELVCECYPGFAWNAIIGTLVSFNNRSLDSVGESSLCNICPTGTFKSQLGNYACSMTSICGIAQFAIQTATTSTDTVCSACPKGTFKTRGGNEACSTCTSICPRGQFLTKNCTTATDIECGLCTLCQFGEYRSGGCDGHVDSICSPCRVSLQDCMPWEYLNGTCDGSSVFLPHCTNISTCGLGQQTKQQPTRTSDRLCMACPSGTYASNPGMESCSSCTSSCSKGKYMSEACTVISDIQCTLCKTPINCSSGEYLQGECIGNVVKNTPPVCAPISLCKPGFQEVISPSPTSDRICIECPEGTFKLAGNTTSEQCSPCSTSCPSGSVLHSEYCSPLSDAQCIPCLAGQYQAFQNKSACMPCPAGEYQPLTGQSSCYKCIDKCDAGYYYSGVCTTKSSPSCVACRPGSYQAAASSNASACTQCGAGTFQNASGQPNCSLCTTVCGEGFYRWGDCTITTTPICSPCPSGHYQDLVGSQTTCKLCTTSCQTGSYLSSPCTLISAAVCSACPPGTYMPAPNNQTSCVTCTTSCTAGSFLTGQCTALSSPVCESCPKGSFTSSAGSQTVCRNCTTQCPSGTFMVGICTATTTPSCGACSSGSYSPSIGSQTSCLACTSICRPGYYLNGSCTSTSTPICVPCSFGYYSPTAGSQTSCTPCTSIAPMGQYLLGECTPSTSPKSLPCPPGMFTTASNSQSVCTACTVTCAAGMFLNGSCTATSTPVCESCPTGSFSPSAGSQTSCGACISQCLAGTILSGNCTSSTTPSCRPCPLGTYNRVAGTQTSCLPCYNSCNAGSYLNGSCTSTTTPTCLPCDSGYYASTAGAQTSCTPCTSSCSAGYYLSGSCTSLTTPSCISCNSISCVSSAWSPWSSCSVSCGGGSQSQVCLFPNTPENWNSACPAVTLSNFRQCGTSRCPVDCGVSAWSSWTSCSASCGGGDPTTISIRVNTSTEWGKCLSFIG